MSSNNNEVIESNIGKKIEQLYLCDEDILHFVFSDGTKMRICDNAGYCCEKRYMHTDDNLNDYVGDEFEGIEIKPIKYDTDDDDVCCHDVQFLEIQTNKGSFTMVSHNEHNGFYAGFDIVVEVE